GLFEAVEAQRITETAGPARLRRPLAPLSNRRQLVHVARPRPLGGQGKRKRSSFARRTLEPDFAAVGFDHLLDDGEPEPGAVAFSLGDERLEHFVADGLGNS